MASPAPSIYDQQIISVDSDDTDYDTYFTEGGITSTAASLASQVTDYRYENGRRYHAYHEGSYWAPNDQAQSDQLELFHHIYLMRLGGELYLAPIGDNPERILDLGTGTGSWCIDVAEIHRNARVIGNDLSPIQPSHVPPNVTFEVDDFNDEWVHPANHFDFVHARAVYGCVKNWSHFLKSALRVLKPGGWFESVETMVECACDDGSLPPDTNYAKWVENARTAGERSGITFDVAGNVNKWCEEAGFIEIEQRSFKLPIGPWPKDKNEKLMGNFNLLNMLSAMEGFSLSLHTRYLDFTLPELLEFIELAKKDMTNKRYHMYFRMFVCCARKPGGLEVRPASPSSTIRPSLDLRDSGGDTDKASI